MRQESLGEVHRFSAWKALAAVISGSLVVFVPLFLIVVAFRAL